MDADKSLPAGIAVVSGPESDQMVVKALQAVIGDGHPMRIAAEVVVSFL